MTQHQDIGQSVPMAPLNGQAHGRRTVGKAPASADPRGGALGTAAGRQPDTTLRRPRGERRDALLEHFRRLYLSVQPLDRLDVPPTLGVTSALRREGRTSIATGMAAAMAMDLGAPVVLIEVDVANPGVHRLLGIPPEPGICEYLRGECEIGTAVRQIADQLFVLPAGNTHGDAARLIRQLTTADLRQRLDSSGAVLVFDLPPILDSSFGVMATSMAESLVMVVRAGHTTIPQVKDALSRLDESLVRELVVNGAEPVLPRWLRRQGFARNTGWV
ncbi:MAG TPA: CpsD/CapB family tyrosine-protein kinase [Ktedonobacterales bacterium]|nr:CpsD/CapB family tyrosine-protein kinase [Ktedonobacterales bacterium]